MGNQPRPERLKDMPDPRRQADGGIKNGWKY